MEKTQNKKMFGIISINFQIWMKSDGENFGMPAGVLMYGEDYREVFGKEFAKCGNFK